MSRKEKREERQRASTRQLIGAREVTDYSLVTYGQGEIVYFIVNPSNISMLSPSSVGGQDLRADDGAERRGGDRDAVLKQPGEL